MSPIARIRDVSGPMFRDYKSARMFDLQPQLENPALLAAINELRPCSTRELRGIAVDSPGELGERGTTYCTAQPRHLKLSVSSSHQLGPRRRRALPLLRPCSPSTEP